MALSYHHPARLKSASLAGGVHGLALLLAWVASQGAPSAPSSGHGVQVTTVTIASPTDDPAPSEAAETRPRDKPEPARAMQAPAASAPPMMIAPPPVLAVLPLAEPGKAAVTASPGPPQHGDGPAGGAPPATATAEPKASPGEATPSKSANTYAIRIFRHIHEVKDYPARLARTGLCGRVLVRFNITTNGNATDIAIAMSSGVAVLDALALEQIRGAMPYPLPPRELAAEQRHFIVPMTYRAAS